MWPWVIVGMLCLLPALLMIGLYRRATRTAHFPLHPNGGDATLEIDSLLGQLEDAADLVIARLEAKQNEVEAMIRLLDAKLEAVQMAMQTQAQREESVVPSRASRKNEDVSEDLLARHELVKTLLQVGLDPLTIAQRTGLRLDEVRLIISLCGRRDHLPGEQ